MFRQQDCRLHVSFGFVRDMDPNVPNVPTARVLFSFAGVGVNKAVINQGRPE